MPVANICILVVGSSLSVAEASDSSADKKAGFCLSRLFSAISGTKPIAREISLSVFFISDARLSYASFLVRLLGC